MLFTSLVPHGFPLLIHVTFLVFHVYTIFVVYLSAFSVIHGALIYGALVAPLVIKEFRLDRSRYRSLSDLRESHTLMLEYRGVEILQKFFNNLVGFFLLPIQTLVTLMFMFGLFMVINHKNEMETIPLVLVSVWAVITPLVWGGWLMACAYFYTNGLKTMNSWKCHNWNSKEERVLMNKFRASCRPLSIGYKTLYRIRPGSVLVFVRGLIRGLKRTLLALRTH